MNRNYTILKTKLDSLYRTYNGDYLETDPLKFVRRYAGRENREIVGLISAALAYGNVNQICTSIEKILVPMGLSPLDFVRKFDIHVTTDVYRAFVHRFNRGKDVALLLYYLHQIYERYPSIEAFFAEGYSRDDETIEKGLSHFVSRVLGLDCSPFYRGALPKSAGVRFLLSSPANGSACKRMNMFLRWMVRQDDGVDCGLWNTVNASQLILPLDSHTARICSYIGLTGRRNTSWLMALEVTGNLRILSPDDPTKYDFALSRLGILDLCFHRYKAGICEQCRLFTVCRLTQDIR